MIIRRIQDDERTLRNTGFDVPLWIDSNITWQTIASIYQGGCASGAYMPAVTYWDAIQTMSQHGDDVLEYITDCLGDLPQIRSDSSWGQIAVLYLSCAVDLFASVCEHNYASVCDDEEVAA